MAWREARLAARPAPCRSVVFPVVLFWSFRRGGGVLFGCANESPSLLKKSPMGLPASAEGPPAKNAVADKIKMSRLTVNSIVGPTLHVPSNLFNL